jgi:hypothetical protein
MNLYSVKNLDSDKFEFNEELNTKLELNKELDEKLELN